MYQQYVQIARLERGNKKGLLKWKVEAGYDREELERLFDYYADNVVRREYFDLLATAFNKIEKSLLKRTSRVIE